LVKRGEAMAFKRILGAVDFSPESVRALRVAAELARQSRGALHILHVIEAQPVVSEWLPVNGLSEMMLTLEEKAEAAMRKLVESLSRELEGIKLTTEINNGRAFVEITNRARDWKADLIVMGAKGAATLEEIVFGSTAEHVVREAVCSVLIVR
jgi:nucleotide-binding universal stress UspA family protein